MQRREFIQTLSAAALVWHGIVPGTASAGVSSLTVESSGDEGVKDHLLRVSRPDVYYEGDILIAADQKPLLFQLHQRLRRLQKTVGHGNFALISIDEMRRYARNYSVIGDFSSAELNLLEQLFYTDASRYGFNGEKPLNKLSATIDPLSLQRQPGTSQYLFKSSAQTTYLTIKQVLGDELILTSGVRGVVKQMYLFLNKAVASGGNLSRASRSLAPPGYSFHGIGDFDVGKRGWGARNFTSDFAKSDEFKRLQDLGFITMRYPEDNQLGVRYEPWHIKVTSL